MQSHSIGKTKGRLMQIADCLSRQFRSSPRQKYLPKQNETSNNNKKCDERTEMEHELLCWNSTASKFGPSLPPQISWRATKSCAALPGAVQHYNKCCAALPSAVQQAASAVKEKQSSTSIALGPGNQPLCFVLHLKAPVVRSDCTMVELMTEDLWAERVRSGNVVGQHHSDTPGRKAPTPSALRCARRRSHPGSPHDQKRSLHMMVELKWKKIIIKRWKNER